jgi:hypothetical protein
MNCSRSAEAIHKQRPYQFEGHVAGMPLRRQIQSQLRPSRKGGMAAALRTGTADSQDESRRSAIHRVKSNGGARKF